MINNNTYLKTLQILRGEACLEPVCLELKDWLKDRFGIDACNFVLKESELMVLLLSTAHYKSMLNSNMCEFSKRKQNEIAKMFCHLLKKHDMEDMCRNQNITVSYIDFSAKIKEEINNRVSAGCKEYIEQKYHQYAFWNLYAIGTGVAVFFDTEKDVKINNASGICGVMREDYFKALKEMDEFNVYSFDDFVMTFDSRENLEKTYNGNIYAYGYK